MQLKINPNNPEPTKIKKAVEILENSGVIVYPTDTIYGLGCDIFKKNAIEKIYQIKKRDKKKPLSIICSDFKQAAEYAIIQDYAFRLMKKSLPGAYTFILKAKSKLPQRFLAKNKTVGIRIPDNKICLDLVSALGHPIISTSLNISGQPVLTNPNQLDKETANKLDLTIDAGDLTAQASTIIDLSQEAPILIREGQGDLSIFNL